MSCFQIYFGKDKRIIEELLQLKNNSYLCSANRGVVQLASILAWGASGRQFESGRSDLKNGTEFSDAVFLLHFETRGQSLYFPILFQLSGENESQKFSISCEKLQKSC